MSSPPVLAWEIPPWGTTASNVPDIAALEAALVTYLDQANRGGSYQPDPEAWLEVTQNSYGVSFGRPRFPEKDSVYYRIEGELFPLSGTTRVQPGTGIPAAAQTLASDLHQDLQVWTAYDFVRKSSEGFQKPFDPPVPVFTPPAPDLPPARLLKPEPVAIYHRKEIGTPVFTARDVEAWIDELNHTDFRNYLPEGAHLRIFDRAAVAVGAAEDPIFARLQDPEVVGPMQRLPADWVPGARSVISFFLGFTDEVVRTYRLDERYSSLEYSSAKWNGSKFLNVVRRHLIRRIEAAGGQAVAPAIDPHYGAVGFRPYWSERHVGFSTGLGTFGLHQGLISRHGVMGRLGSVVTDLEFELTPRTTESAFGNCPFYTDGSCGACIRRCPTQAISVHGKIPGQCLKNGNGEFHKASGYGACGHCSTFVPCSRRKPGQ